jgi:D-xylose 1-dehydrogenase (NADP+, D-xylono-1,5-lactone-forming)
VLRLGLLSTARINRAILDAAVATGRVEVVAVASRDAARAAEYAHENGIPRSHSSYDALLADTGVDAVYLPLPNGLHHEWTMRSLAAGKHVLCEKPFSRRPAEVEEAFDAASERALVLMEAFMYRHHPQTGVVAKLVSEGAIGRLRAVRASFAFHLDRPEDVRLDLELDGGALMDVGCYCVNASRLLAGEPVRVQGEQVVAETGVDLAFHGMLRSADDVVAQIDCSFTLPRQQRLEAFGEAGSLFVEAPFRPDWGGDVLLQRGEDTSKVEVPEANPFERELENFADAVEGAAEPLLGREDAVGQARTLDALYRAAKSSESVAL